MVKITVSLSQELLERLDRYAAEHLEDRSTALLQERFDPLPDPRLQIPLHRLLQLCSLHLAPP